MTQAPATPKLRRAATLARASLGLPAPAPLAASETAALRLRARGPARAAPEGVVFLIPFVGRHHVGDWDAVTGRLAATVESLRRQSDPRWRALICGQDRPDLPEDARVTFLPFKTPVEGNDKWAKLDMLARALPHAGLGAGYVMSFDADDLAHPALVPEMLAREVAGGWLAAEGYVRDAATGAVARAAPPTPAAPLRKPFWKLCGSCAALRFDLAQEPETTAFLAAMTAHEHRMFPYLAALAGRRLSRLPRPLVLYELNHGENFGLRRGRVGFKTRFVARFAVGAAEREAVARAFPSPDAP
ncbi:hypothetical protein DRV85_02205 [Rhodosalinus halophilus]|uniref:Glycosyl transferase family 2 n=1 Tax=Rhodosalinus halophilus TaxID=2259333 RepID=A0A365UCU9_9RHOB|nr:hypothetical protein [Rhodosalinus halophilus]RBI86958.1 hypothetical protein DRV85_02205 [Rhodosalinus halophilus]